MILECFASVDEDNGNLLVIFREGGAIVVDIYLLKLEEMPPAQGSELVLDRVAKAASGLGI
jgi:hypothetical protein